MDIPSDPPDEPKSAEDMIEKLEDWNNVESVNGPVGIPESLLIRFIAGLDRDNLDAIEWAGWKIDMITDSGVWIEKDE